MIFMGKIKDRKKREIKELDHLLTEYKPDICNSEYLKTDNKRYIEDCKLTFVDVQNFLRLKNK